MAKFGLLTCLGSPLTVPLLDAMKAQGLLPAAVIVDGTASQKDRDIDRERLDPSFPFLDLPNIHLDAPVYFVKNHNSEAAVALVRSLGLDYLANAGTPRILKAPLLRATKGVINCHPGILPAYRGCTCLEWSIHYNDPVGATAHLMSESIDEGPMLASETMEVKAPAEYRAVRTAMLYHQAQLMVKAFQRINRGDTNFPPLPAGGNYHKPIPADLLVAVKAKLEIGAYSSPRA